MTPPMRRTAITAAALTSAFMLTACGGDDEDQAAGGTPGQTEVDPGLGEAQSQQNSDPEASDGAQNQSHEAQGEQDEGQDSEPESPAEGAEQAYQQALEDSEQLAAEGDDFSEYAIDDQEFGEDLDFGEFMEERTVVLERGAELMTSFEAGDWNKDVAIIRATHLMAEGTEQPGIPESPQTGDEAWDTAMECNATAEVRTELVEDEGADDSDDAAHSATREVAAEYRWVDGDEGCDLIQPDHYYVYSMAMNDDAEISQSSREQISYGEDDSGLFDD